MTPPAYPRTPYLITPSQLSRSDRVVPPAEAPSWYTTPVHVEEKLDGANVSLWLEAGTVRVATRGGAGAMDRGGQLGPLRAWAAANVERLTALLGGGWSAYGEWLWLRHGIAYDRLPDFLTVLDLWHPASGMAPVPARDARTAAAGLLTPPVRHHGSLNDERALLRLLGPSAYVDAPAEGLVLRRIADDARCKVVDPRYRRLDDQQFATGVRNSLAAARTP